MTTNQQNYRRATTQRQRAEIFHRRGTTFKNKTKKEATQSCVTKCNTQGSHTPRNQRGVHGPAHFTGHVSTGNSHFTGNLRTGSGTSIYSTLNQYLFNFSGFKNERFAKMFSKSYKVKKLNRCSPFTKTGKSTVFSELNY